MTVNIKCAKALLENKKIIGVKTDTVFGFVVLKEYDYKLYELKKRNKNKKLIRFVNKIDSNLDQELKAQMYVKWPGRYTYVYNVLGEFNSFRMPNEKKILELIGQLEGKKLMSSSANISGEKPCISRSEFEEKFPNIPLLECDFRECSKIPSTIILYNKKKFIKIRK